MKINENAALPLGTAPPPTVPTVRSLKGTEGRDGSQVGVGTERPGGAEDTGLCRS